MDKRFLILIIIFIFFFISSFIILILWQKGILTRKKDSLALGMPCDPTDNQCQYNYTCTQQPDNNFICSEPIPIPIPSEIETNQESNILIQTGVEKPPENTWAYIKNRLMIDVPSQNITDWTNGDLNNAKLKCFQDKNCKAFEYKLNDNILKYRLKNKPNFINLNKNGLTSNNPPDQGTYFYKPRLPFLQPSKWNFQKGKKSINHTFLENKDWMYGTWTDAKYRCNNNNDCKGFLMLFDNDKKMYKNRMLSKMGKAGDLYPNSPALVGIYTYLSHQ
jgi:hypothetical protein